MDIVSKECTSAEVGKMELGSFDKRLDTLLDALTAKIFDNLAKFPPRYVTDVELARTLSVSLNSIRKWRSQGRIKPYEFGRSVRYRVDEVVAKLTQKGHKKREK